MDPPAPPIDAGLWGRLKRLDPQCVIHFSREAPGQARWRGFHRVWLAMIKHEDAKAYDWVKVEHPYFCEAVRQAVEDAEARGWARSP